MNDLQVFRFQAEKNIRAFEEDGDIWFVAKDVAEALEYERFDSNLVEKVPEMWKGTKRIRTLGGDQEMICLTEQGFYFFVIRSDKPGALPLQMYCAGTVLPAIRKTGRYIVPRKTHTKAEIEAAGRDFFMDCCREGGLAGYLRRRYPDDINRSDPRNKGSVKLTRQERSWLEEAETEVFLVREGRL